MTITNQIFRHSFSLINLSSSYDVYNMLLYHIRIKVALIHLCDIKAFSYMLYTLFHTFPLNMNICQIVEYSIGTTTRLIL